MSEESRTYVAVTNSPSFTFVSEAVYEDRPYFMELFRRHMLYGDMGTWPERERRAIEAARIRNRVRRGVAEARSRIRHARGALTGTGEFCECDS